MCQKLRLVKRPFRSRSKQCDLQLHILNPQWADCWNFIAVLWLVEIFDALAFWLTGVSKYSCEQIRSSNFNQSGFQAKDLINQLLEDSTLTEDKKNGFKEKLKTIPESTHQNDSENTRLENCVIFSPNSGFPSLRWNSL